jgi:hypothetical protein
MKVTVRTSLVGDFVDEDPDSAELVGGELEDLEPILGFEDSDVGVEIPDPHHTVGYAYAVLTVDAPAGQLLATATGHGHSEFRLAARRRSRAGADRPRHQPGHDRVGAGLLLRPGHGGGRGGGSGPRIRAAVRCCALSRQATGSSGSGWTMWSTW